MFGLCRLGLIQPPNAEGLLRDEGREQLECSLLPTLAPMSIPSRCKQRKIAAVRLAMYGGFGRLEEAQVLLVMDLGRADFPPQRDAAEAGRSQTMLCDDCRELIQLADQEFESATPENPFVAKREVSTAAFAASVHGECYLCTRLLIQLGDAKWQHILSDLPGTNLVAFDKSAHCHPPSLILVRLGCKLTPITAHEQDATPVLGKSYSYGYLQIAVLPKYERWATFSQLSPVCRSFSMLNNV